MTPFAGWRVFPSQYTSANLDSPAASGCSQYRYSLSNKLDQHLCFHVYVLFIPSTLSIGNFVNWQHCVDVTITQVIIPMPFRIFLTPCWATKLDHELGLTWCTHIHIAFYLYDDIILWVLKSRVSDRFLDDSNNRTLFQTLTMVYGRDLVSTR